MKYVECSFDEARAEWEGATYTYLDGEKAPLRVMDYRLFLQDPQSYKFFLSTEELSIEEVLDGRLWRKIGYVNWCTIDRVGEYGHEVEVTTHGWTAIEDLSDPKKWVWKHPKDF